MVPNTVYRDHNQAETTRVISFRQICISYHVVYISTSHSYGHGFRPPYIHARKPAAGLPDICMFSLQAQGIEVDFIDYHKHIWTRLIISIITTYRNSKIIQIWKLVIIPYIWIYLEVSWPSSISCGQDHCMPETHSHQVLQNPPAILLYHDVSHFLPETARKHLVCNMLCQPCDQHYKDSNYFYTFNQMVTSKITHERMTNSG